MKTYLSLLSSIYIVKGTFIGAAKCNILCRVNKKCVNNFYCLKDIDLKNSKPFLPELVYGKVIKVYDGDTITVASKIPSTDNKIYRYPVRLRGIDAPEIRSKYSKEMELAHMSKQALHELIYEKIVRLDNVKTEKYGRLLADVFLGDLHINKWLLENNYAIPYDGKAKNTPDEWK